MDQKIQKVYDFSKFPKDKHFVVIHGSIHFVNKEKKDIAIFNFDKIIEFLKEEGVEGIVVKFEDGFLCKLTLYHIEPYTNISWTHLDLNKKTYIKLE